MYHREVSHPRQPYWYIGGQITTEQLGCQRVEGADCDAHLHVHAACAYEESYALSYYCVEQQKRQQSEEHKWGMKS